MSDIKSLVINCKIISGTINFLIFDKSNKNLIEKVMDNEKELQELKETC